MARPISYALGGIAVAALIGKAAGELGHRARRRDIAWDVAELFASSADGERTAVEDSELTGLPDPVQRWLRYANVVGTERPCTVRLKQVGQFRLDPRLPWMPFGAEEYFAIDPPGFVWSARIGVAPLLAIEGRDRYLDGKGHMDFGALALVPVVSASGPELDQGALLRFLNEIMWFPAAALSPYISWEAMDADSARATMSYEGVSASAVFIFDAEGKPTNVEAMRYRQAGGRFVLDNWATPLSGYGEFEGVRVPTEGEAVWKLQAGDFAYIRLRVTDLEYDRTGMY